MQSGNRLYRDNVIDGTFSELYGYDDLNQLNSFKRGTLSDGNSDGIPDTIASPTREQSWTLDVMGNWDSLNTDGSPESRTHNAQSEVTGVGASTLTFDNNGNLTKDEKGNDLIYDAWNRLVEVKLSGTTLAGYAYDAGGRRVTEVHGSTTRELFYSSGWQVLEEQDGSGQLVMQYVWSPVYVDAMVLRDRDMNNDGDFTDLGDERLYVQQDANFNVTALIDTSGAVVERYVYDVYGSVTVIDNTWTPLSSSFALSQAVF